MIWWANTVFWWPVWWMELRKNEGTQRRTGATRHCRREFRHFSQILKNHSVQLVLGLVTLTMTKMTATTTRRKLSLHLLLLWLPLVTPFSPAAPPRFDVFCETIVGSWMTPIGADDSTSKPQSVDEVMRSCGGAVQGIKEMACQKAFYLNRADDGFIYFDCGSYSYGPLLVAEDATPPSTSTSSTSTMSSSGDSKEEDEETTTYMASLSISKVRIVVTVNGDMKGNNHHHAVLYPKASIPGESDSPPQTLSIISTKPKYEVGRQLQCRMSSPSQPWMLQRAQWESRRALEPAENEDPLTLLLPSNEGAYECWLEQVQVPAPAGDDRTSSTTTKVSMGICCTTSGYVKEITRTYDSSDSRKLTRVTLQEGRLIVWWSDQSSSGALLTRTWQAPLLFLVGS